MSNGIVFIKQGLFSLVVEHYTCNVKVASSILVKV